MPRALGDLVELLGDDVVEVRQSVGSEEVIDDGELGRAGALLLGFILGGRLGIDVGMSFGVVGADPEVIEIDGETVRVLNSRVPAKQSASTL